MTETTSKTYGIVAAAGLGVRMGTDRPKQFLELVGRPVLAHSIEAVARAGFLSGIVVVVPQDYLAEARTLVEAHVRCTVPIDVIGGGAERQDSVFNALSALPPECDWVVIHDGVRPFASRRLMEAVWAAARETGAAIAAVPATDTIKRVRAGRVQETLPRDEIWLVQTPQVFARERLVDAYREAARQGWMVTDDASLAERVGLPVAVVPGEVTNIKLTTPEDLAWAAWFLEERRRVYGTAAEADG